METQSDWGSSVNYKKERLFNQNGSKIHVTVKQWQTHGVTIEKEFSHPATGEEH